jgi:CubicO group peptidase (beta-lactamase class C family)
MAIYISRDGAEDIRAFGVRHVEIGAPVDHYTVLEAASLSKPVVALAALQFVDEGKLDLDEPLSQLAGALVPDDPATAMITTCHVLSHVGSAKLATPRCSFTSLLSTRIAVQLFR